MTQPTKLSKRPSRQTSGSWTTSGLLIEAPCPGANCSPASGRCLSGFAPTTATPIRIWRPSTRLERLHDRTRTGRSHAGMNVDRDQLNSGRYAKRRIRCVLERHFHKVTENRRRIESGLRAATERTWLVVAHEHAEREVWRIAYEPKVLRIVRCPGFAREMFTDFLNRDAGAALDDALKNRRHLIGGQRIDHLLAFVYQMRLGLIVPCLGVAAIADPFVMFIDRIAPAILDSIN